MENSKLINNCEICNSNSICICFECSSYLCNNCYNIIHNNEERKNHIKRKIDNNININVKCPIHPKHPIELFCIEEKSKLKKCN